MLKDGLVRSWPLLIVSGLGVVALFIAGAEPVAVGLVPPPYDKLAHAIVFGLLFLLLDRALILPLWVAIAIPLLVSGADEIHQMWLPGRQPGWDDWLAGLVGVIVAVVIVRRLRT